MVTGVYSSDTLYDFITQPLAMRFKYTFDHSKWPEQFAWLEMPADLQLHPTDGDLTVQRLEQGKARAKLLKNNENKTMNARQVAEMEQEISQLLQRKGQIDIP